MIVLTRLNGHPFSLNCDLIKLTECSPDTTLTLVTGEKLIVQETPAALHAAVVSFRGAVLRAAWPDAAQALSVRVARSATDLQSTR